MAKRRSKIPKATIQSLIAEAGGKCANPGCPAIRTEIHHIRLWAVFETHDSNHLIAVCPNCHDAIHNGRLKISDSILYLWKKTSRDYCKRAHIYIEPAATSSLLAGTCEFASKTNHIIFKLSELNILEFHIVDNEYLSVNATISNFNGNICAKVVDNHIRIYNQDDLEIYQRPGKLLVMAPLSTDYLPEKVIFFLEHYFYCVPPLTRRKSFCNIFFSHGGFNGGSASWNGDTRRG